MACEGNMLPVLLVEILLLLLAGVIALSFPSQDRQRIMVRTLQTNFMLSPHSFGFPGCQLLSGWLRFSNLESCCWLQSHATACMLRCRSYTYLHLGCHAIHSQCRKIAKADSKSLAGLVSGVMNSVAHLTESKQNLTTFCCLRVFVL